MQGFARQTSNKSYQESYNMKKSLIPLLLQNAAHSKPLKKNAEKYVQKLQTFSHAPLSTRDARRIERFSADASLVEMVAGTLLNDYPVWEPHAGYDTIYYWYSMALLCINPNEKVSELLLAITKNMSRSGFEDIHLLRQMFDFFPDTTALGKHREEINNFYQAISPGVESLQWIKQLGLPEPVKDWRISFEFSTDGERKFDFNLTPEEKISRMEILVTVNSVAKGNGHSWRLIMYNPNKTVRAHWTGPQDRSIRVDDVDHILPVKPSLLNFAATLEQIENIVNTKFVRKPVRVYFTSGLKGKSAIARWMEKL